MPLSCPCLPPVLVLLVTVLHASRIKVLAVGPVIVDCACNALLLLLPPPLQRRTLPRLGAACIAGGVTALAWR